MEGNPCVDAYASSGSVAPVHLQFSGVCASREDAVAVSGKRTKPLSCFFSKLLSPHRSTLLFEKERRTNDHGEENGCEARKEGIDDVQTIEALCQ